MLLLTLALLVDPSTYVGNVYGTVVDRTNVPIAGATVTVIGDWPLCSATTDATGAFLINSIPAPDEGRRYALVVTHPDYASAEIPDAQVLPGASMALEVNATLTREASSIHAHYRHEQTFAPSPHGRQQSNNFTRTVFATREGLVGGTTANGHVIVENDHFVALPSRRALSTNFGHEREVRITFGARTVIAPVWDVGPWNTTDDYWNPPLIRQSFTDLPRGKPEAEAAFLEGYNSGRDGRGRTVLNPAGIDLADGTFRVDLALPTNSYIEVEYLWLDSVGPQTAALNASPNPSNVGTVSVQTQANDDSPIDAAEYFVDQIGASGSGTPATPADGAFDSPAEAIRADFVTGWAPGSTHTVYVHARDAYGNWGEFSSITISAAAPSPRHRAAAH